MTRRRAVLLFQTLTLASGGLLAMASPPKDLGQFVSRAAGFLALAMLPLVLGERDEPRHARLTRKARRAATDFAAHDPFRRGLFR